MTPSQFNKRLAQVEKAQALIESFYDDFKDHFEQIDAYEIDMTYCKGDGFLLLDGNHHSGLVFNPTKEVMEKLLKLKTDVEVYDFFKKLHEESKDI